MVTSCFFLLVLSRWRFRVVVILVILVFVWVDVGIFMCGLCMCSML